MKNIIEDFISLAIEDGKANEEGNYRVVNRLYKKFKGIFKKIETTENYEEIYKVLLTNNDKYVSYKAAVRCLTLGIMTDDSEKILRSVEKEKGTLAFISGMILKKHGLKVN